ncbi:carotenoid ester lipase precursor [Mycena galericulata]|nr:carotenoid ester lipase precursor [Mycena galericulata]
MHYPSYVIALSAFLSISTASVSPIVSLDYGTFLGAKDGNLTKFLGVPFCKPTARWELPGKPEPLKGLQNVTSFGPTCPQQTLSPGVPFSSGNYTYISEDCLTLDVFTPASNPGAKLPVLVWLFGGGFDVGSSSATDMRPIVEHSIVLGEPVVIVAANYRLSAFGFLSGKEASAAGITNLGLRDQIFALEWVQQHISAFGGDPKRVVLGGVSAGAMSTALLLLSNKRVSPGLFRGAFMLGGSPFPYASQADGQPYYDQLVTANNCTAAKDTLQCLRGIPYDAFIATVNETPNILSYEGLKLIWAPHVDGDVVVQNPSVSVSQGGFAKIPFIIGDCDDEGTLFSFATSNVTTDIGFQEFIENIALGPKGTPAQVSKVLALYPQDPVQGSPFGTGTANQLTPEFKRTAAFETDFRWVAPRRAFLQKASSTQNTWSWLSKRGKSTPYLGAYHTSDMPLFFPPNSSALTETVAVDALINFLNTLDPNVSAAPLNLRKQPSIFWPKWQEPSVNGSSSLLTFSDPLVVNITADDFRAGPVQYLSDLNLAGITI